MIDNIDKKIINRIQSDFPLNSRPFLIIANELELSEDEVINRIISLKEKGIIRRIGGNFPPDKVGFVSTLCAAKVEKEKITSFTSVVNSYKGVTHNYQRDGNYNIWFTFIEKSMDEIENNLKEISEKTGISDIINLPATKVFKVKAQFEL